jgi:hypothetical protein
LEDCAACKERLNNRIDSKTSKTLFWKTVGGVSMVLVFMFTFILATRAAHDEFVFEHRDPVDIEYIRDSLRSMTSAMAAIAIDIKDTRDRVIRLEGERHGDEKK